MRGGRGGYSPTRVSLASFSLHRAKRMKSRQRNLQHNYKIKVIRLTSPDAVRRAACQWKKKLVRAQAARALPFPFGRKRKQKGPFCTALRQRKNEATIQPVRRTFPNSTPHGVSNTWKGSFLPLPCAAGAKIPSRATQKDSAGAASAFRKLLNAQSAAGNARFLQPFVA